MKLTASPQVAAFVREHGGRVFVWAHVHACCGGFTSLVARSEPDPNRIFTRLEAPGFELWLDPGRSSMPDELVLEIRGRRRPRVEAYWDGCAFVP
jgi:Ni,Fe-hydrogenase I small subunit